MPYHPPSMNDLSVAPVGFSASYARLVADHLRAMDMDAQPVLQALGLPEADSDQSPRWVTARQLTEALHLTARLCQDPDIGLTIGQQMRPANMGSLGYALTSCTDLQDGLALFERVQSLVCTQVRAEHRLKGDVMESHMETLGDVPRDTLLWTFTMVSRLAFARWVSGRRLNPLMTWLPCPPPADPAPLLAYVGGPIEFNAARAGERVPANWLQLPNPNADPALHQLMSAMTAQQWAALGRDQTQLISVLRQHIGWRLQQGELPLLDKLGPDLEDALGLTGRQLQRRLAEQGLNFKDLVEQVRKERVLHELRHTSLPLHEVAHRAAYAEVSSMHRAVRRWTGLTPTGVRSGLSSTADTPSEEDDADSSDAVNP
ncbi:MAG: AraC family transcriptional regulator ligand-binding domain-containing protein [Aquabacterium sp.]